jgi:prophage tail gpP-like protein
MIAPDAEELTIKTGGKTLGGWQEIHVVRGVERLPSAFYIRMTERFPGQLEEISATPGATCEISMSGDLLLTGYIDRYLPRIDKGQHSVLLMGRSKPEDLVDSSLFGEIIGGWNLQVSTLKEAAERISKPFGIEVSAPDGDFPLPPPQNFPINPGMTAGQLLEELARTTGSLVWDDPRGRLVISAVGTGRAGSALVEGTNVEAASLTLSMDGRFSDYIVIVLGQNFLTGTTFRNHLAHVVDPGVKALGRYRTRIIPWEAPDQDGSYSDNRALWEAARRFGRGNIVQVKVTGWRDGTGKLWAPNSVVRVKLPSCKVDRDLVISEVAWERGPEMGTTAQLTCMPKEGLVPQPLIIQLPVKGVNEAAPH